MKRSKVDTIVLWAMIVIGMALALSKAQSQDNQDGYIDLTDVLTVYFDSQFSARFYPDVNRDGSLDASDGLVTDLNGDGIVDLTDLLIVTNNAINFVQARSPLNE